MTKQEQAVIAAAVAFAAQREHRDQAYFNTREALLGAVDALAKASKPTRKKTPSTKKRKGRRT